MEEFMIIDGVEVGIIILTCCREWPILIGVPWGYCGFCGEKPRKRD